MQIAEHPTVKAVQDTIAAEAAAPAPAKVLDAAEIRELCLAAGADDAGFAEIGHPELDGQRDDILKYFPPAKTLISIVCRMNREPIRNTARSVANLEFHHTGDQVDEVTRRIVAALEKKGIRALGPSMGFPMEMDHFPGKIWVVSHKPVAVAAGLGRMGIHRNVIHPKFGNFILLGTVLVAAEVSSCAPPLDFNPCLECKLCVAACPVGAISPDGDFNFSACYTHNYQEFMGGFTGWVEQVADSKNALDYRSRVSDSESASMWQSLSFGANYKAAYCLAVCPAGEDVIAPFLTDRKQFLDENVRPLQQKKETVYVVPGSDAEAHVERRFPHKKVKRVAGSLRPRSVDGFLNGLPLVFQREQSAGLGACYHFTFTGIEGAGAEGAGGGSRKATVIIRDKTLSVMEGHRGEADLRVTADTATWLGFLAKEKNLVWAFVRGKIRLKGSPKLLLAFGKCFPS